MTTKTFVANASTEDGVVWFSNNGKLTDKKDNAKTWKTKRAAKTAINNSEFFAMLTVEEGK